MPPPRRTRSRGNLERAVTEAAESADRLRQELQGYEKRMRKLSARLAKGDPAVSAADATNLPLQGRRPVSDGIDDFEAVRHRLRRALIAVGQEEGISIAEVGRVLGISRQLASRIAQGKDR